MNKPIRVLYWGMTDELGGIESFIINVYRHIDKSKVQIDFLLSHDNKKIAFEDEIIQMGGKIYRVMYSERESLFKSRSSLNRFFKTHNDYEAVHIHANFPYVFPLKYAKKYGVPKRILHTHNCKPQDKYKKGIRNIIHTLRNKQIEHQIAKFPNYYFACSDFAAEYMFPNQNYIWIKNGIDLKKFDYDEVVRSEVRKELGITDDYQVLGFIGSIRYQKNPAFIVKIFLKYLKINPKTILLIVGTGEFEELLKEKTKKYIEKKQIVFLGNRTDPQRLYQAMDAFLLPSFYEGLPIVLVESQAAGLPCFASDVITGQVKLTDLVEYCSLNDDAEKWTEKIYKKLETTKRKGYYECLLEKGFDIESVAKELEKFYLSQEKVL